MAQEFFSPPPASGGGGGGTITGSQNSGTGTGIINGVSGTDLVFKSLIAGVGISIVDNGNDININGLSVVQAGGNPAAGGFGANIFGTSLTLGVAHGLVDQAPPAPYSAQGLGVASGIVTFQDQSFSGRKRFCSGLSIGNSPFVAGLTIAMNGPTSGSSYTLNWPAAPARFNVLRKAALDAPASSAYEWASPFKRGTSGDSDATVTAGNAIHGVGATTVPRTITLPLAANVPSGFIVIVKDEGATATANPITVLPAGADTQDEVTVISIDKGCARQYSDGVSAWYSC